MAQRILRGAAAALTYEHLNADGEAVDASGTVTVRVVRADGTEVLAAGTATTKLSDAGEGVYQVAVTPAQTATLDVLTATWTDSAAPSAARSTEHEVVGGYLFTIGDVYELNGMQGYDRSAVIARRNEVEDECEWICDVAWVPRYRRITVDGSGTIELVTGVRRIRRVRAVTVYPVAGGVGTALTAGQIAGLVPFPDGTIRRTDGDVWTSGFGNVVVEVEHGFDGPPADLKAAAAARCQDLLLNPDSQVPMRARAYTDNQSGFSYEIDVPDKMSTGIPRVDAVYRRRSFRESLTGDGAGAPAPASRTMSYDPQFFGLFRGGRT